VSAIQQIEAGVLNIAYEEHGPADGIPAVLLHGFPYDPRTYDAVAPALAAAGIRAIVPYLRGYGPTRFRDPATPRSGEQAALGMDLVALIEALKLDRPVVAGYDWGGRAACVAAALRPDLVRGLVSCGGYNMFGPPITGPVDPEFEHKLWYQYYLHMHRGRMMLVQNRRGFCGLLWKLWSPTWDFSPETFEASAVSFDNPDFVEVVLHSYRHRSGLVPGDPALAGIATRLEQERPSIAVPTIVLHGEDGLAPPAMSADRSRFTASWELRTIPGIGHNLSQEAPEAMAHAVIDLAV
jgi:pimeloyl-ACP methyl ester carboxylesterase